MLLFGNGRESVVRALTFALRSIDRRLKTRASVYGWAFFFGKPLVPDLAVWTNVCIGCGSGVPSADLEGQALVRHRRILPDVYACPRCGTRNLFTRDADLRHLTR